MTQTPAFDDLHNVQSSRGFVYQKFSIFFILYKLIHTLYICPFYGITMPLCEALVYTLVED